MAGVLQTIKPSIGLYLHLTKSCNLACTYCYSGEKKRDRMNLETGKRAIDFFLDRTELLTLRFFGGEPLLEFPLLKELVPYGKQAAEQRKRAIKSVIVTNGTLFTEEVADFCSTNQVDYSISLDGNQASQDANRVFLSGAGSFSTVEKNIPHILRANPWTMVTSVVTPNNAAHLSDSIRYLLERGFRCISLSPDFANPGLEAQLETIKREYLKVADLYLEHRRRGRPLFFAFFDDQKGHFARSRCKLGAEEYSVSPSGEIYPCCCFVDQHLYPLGDVARGFDLAQTNVFQAELTVLNQRLVEEHAGCAETSYCRKGCGCTNVVTTGRMAETAPILCRFGQMEDEVRGYLAAAASAPSVV